jgi:hypothetical protein
MHQNRGEWRLLLPRKWAMSLRRIWRISTGKWSSSLRTFQRRLSLESIKTRNHRTILVHNSRAYVNSLRGSSICIEVIQILWLDISSVHYGTLSSDCSRNAHCLVASKKELFCGFNIGNVASPMLLQPSYMYWLIETIKFTGCRLKVSMEINKHFPL